MGLSFIVNCVAKIWIVSGTVSSEVLTRQKKKKKKKKEKERKEKEKLKGSGFNKQPPKLRVLWNSVIQPDTSVPFVNQIELLFMSRFGLFSA